MAIKSDPSGPGRYNKVVLTFKLTLRMWYVPKDVKVMLPDGTKKARTAAGVARTILHEKEHAKHFSSTFEEIWNMAVTLRGRRWNWRKKWADDKAREIKESIKSGKIYNKWKERVDQEGSHSGEGWDEWYKNNGPAFP